MKRKGGWPKGKKRGPRKRVEFPVTLGSYGAEHKIKENSATNLYDNLFASTRKQINQDLYESTDKGKLAIAEADLRILQHKYEALKELLLDIYGRKS